MRTSARLQFLATVSLLLSTLPSVGSAQESVVCGWDFSQYAGAGALTTDGATLAVTLSANYSDFDPTFGAGAESAAFGTMFIDGSNGSTMTTGGFVPYLPTSGSLMSNIDGPQNGMPSTPFPDVPFDSFQVLASEGQSFTQLLSMLATQAVDVVFGADLSTAPIESGGLWSLTFAGKTLAGTSLVDVEFATGTGDYVAVDTLTLSPLDQMFTVALGNSTEEQVYVRMLFTPDNSSNLPLIDNLMITVPEPGAASSGLVALAALVGLVRCRHTAWSSARRVA